MPRVPLDNIPQVTPDGAPANDYQRIDATPAAFGGLQGQAEQRAGAQTQQAGADASQVAVMLQQRHNELATTGAFNQYQDGVLSLTGGDPNTPGDKGYFGTTGRDAMDGYSATATKMDGLRNQISGGLQNDAQRLAFDQSTRRLQMFTLDSMRSHYLQQSQVYALGLNQAAEQTQQRAVAVQPANDVTFNNSVPEVYRAAVRGAQDRYGTNPDPAIVQSAVAGATTRLVTSRIQAWAPNDPGAALNWLQNGQLPGLDGKLTPVRTAIDPAAYDQLYRGLHEQSSRAAGGALADAAWTGGSGSSSLADAIHGQESGGRSTSPTSVNGARGGWQIQPATFQQYANPGESIDNPADNQAVGQRIVSDYQQRYANDPARVAVAYFSGPGNVAPAGSPTPWLQDKKDGNGTSTSSYVSGVLARLGSGTPAQGQSPRYPDTSAGVQRIIDATQGQPELRQAALGAYEQKVRIYDLQTATERRDIQKNVGDAISALEAGKSDVTIPEDRIRAVFDPATASDLLGKLQTAKSVGQIFSGIQWAAPSEVAAARDDLASGLGTRSALLRASQSPADAGPIDGAVPPMSMPIGTTGERETPDQFGLRQKVLERFDQLVSARAAALKTDPAAYVANSPTVAPTLAALDPKDPASMEAYSRATLAAQSHLGVPEGAQHILTAQQADATVGRLTRETPATSDVGQLLDQTAKQYGSAWPQAFGDLVSLGKLPGEYQVLAAMPDAVARTDFQRALSTISTKGGIAQLREDVPPQAAKDIDAGLDDKLADFRQTVSVPGLSSNIALLTTVRNSVKDLAYYYATQSGDGTAALQKAADAVINSKYDFSGSMRVPKGMLSTAETATANLVSDLKPGDLMPMAADTQATAAGPGMTTEQRQAVTLRAAQHGSWVPNENDTGLVLVSKLSNGAMVQIRRADGSRVELPFAQMEALTKPAAPPTPATVGSTTILGAVQ